MKVSIIIPCYNESRTVAEVLRRVLGVQLPDGVDREIIVVDDGSTDGTARVLRQEACNRDEIRIHVSPSNRGKGAAVRTGLDVAGGDAIVIQDADLELTPEDIPSLLEPIVNGDCDIVFGSRFLRPRQFPLTKAYLANRLLTWLTCLLYHTRISDMETCYKAFRRSVIDNVSLHARSFEIEVELTATFLRLGHRIREVAVTYSPRSAADGKKIRARDGVKAVYYLFKYRLQPRRWFLQ